jgi:hypothetical protein
MLTRNYPLVLASGVAILMFSLVGVAAISGVMPSDISKHNPHATPLLETAAAAASAKKAGCRNCGFVQVVRTVEVVGEGAKRQAYRVSVRMDDGTERTLSFAAQPSVTVGSRVRVNGNALERG